MRRVEKERKSAEAATANAAGKARDAEVREISKKILRKFLLKIIIEQS